MLMATVLIYAILPFRRIRYECCKQRKDYGYLFYLLRPNYGDKEDKNIPFFYIYVYISKDYLL